MKLVNEFLEIIMLPITFWYQITLGMAMRIILGIDHQKLAIMQCFLLKAAWGNIDPSKSPFI